MTLGKGSSATLDASSSLNETFLGVMKLDGSTFLEEVSGWMGEEVFEWEGLIDSSKEQLSAGDESIDEKKFFSLMRKRFLYAENWEMQMKLSQIQTKIELTHAKH